MTGPRLTGLGAVAAFTVYMLSIPLANWMIGHVGTQHFPDGPHTIPVGFGYAAPSGVLAIGVALVARDYIQHNLGRLTALAAIILGVGLSYILADARIATASAAAFALGELADFAVYTPLSERNLPAAVTASGVVGGLIDSFVFLQIAFGSTMFWQGQVIGKTYVALLAGVVIWRVRCVTSRAVYQPTAA